MDPITEPYLLCVNVPTSIDENGGRWTDELWAKDLSLHLDYLTNLTLASPCVRRGPLEKEVSLDGPPFDRLTFVDLPYPRSYGQALKVLPRYVAGLWRGARRASVVHSGFGGWPLSSGWFIAPIGRLQRKFVVTNVESSFWRIRGDGVPLRKRIPSWCMERLARFAVKVADLRLFTSRAYAEEFLPVGAPRAFVLPATWVNEDWVLSDDQAAAAWNARTGPVRLFFAGRLIPDKGLPQLLTAAALAGKDGAELEISIIGEGPLREDCLRAASSDHGQVRINLLDPVPYGEPFLALVRAQDAVLIPSLSDEQPRLLFDAYSQAVPVIGSATGGIRECLEDNATGRLVRPGDAQALAEALTWAARARPELSKLGMAALSWARGRTHGAMHRRRHEILVQMLADRARS